MASANDKTKAHVAGRRIKWRGANPPVYLTPGQKESGKLIIFTLDHVEDAAYLTIIKRGIVRLATAEEQKGAVVLKAAAEVNDGSNS